MASLQGRVILVTGSASGIGEGIVRRIAKAGGAPVIHGREEDRVAGQSLAEELGALFLVGDLLDPETPAAVVEAVIAHHPGLDGLVNNAGVSWRGGIEADSAFFDRVMNINARAPFLMTQAALPHLKRSHGSVVNMCSSNARQGAPNLVPYSMSKAALANMTKAVSGAFVKDGVRINGINLGWTLTENERALNMATNGWAEDWPETIGKLQPLGRLLLPDDVAALVVFLLSEEAQMVTGQVWDYDQRSF